MMLFERARAPDVGAAEVRGLEICDAVSESRRAEPWHAGRFRQPGDFARVLERRGERLVDEQGLTRADDIARLGQVHAAVDAREQHAVDAATELLDRVDDLDPVFVAQLTGESVDAVPA